MSANGVAERFDLAGALAEIERQFGEGAVREIGSRASDSVAAISTGAASLDQALGIGGVARGRVVEVFGPESSGKTTLTYHLIAEAQRAGGRCAFIDAEHSLDPGYAARIGVDVERLLLSQPDCGEQALEIADLLVRSGELALVVIDSVAALVPRAELEGTMEDQQVGLQARMMSKGLRKLAGHLSEAGTTCLFTNQLRERVGVVYGPRETQPGGRALKFFATQRIDLRRIETLKQGEQAVGIMVRAKVVKNKVASPFGQAEFEIEFGKGISKVGCLLDLAVQRSVVKRSGAYFAFGEVRLGRGRATAKAVLEERAELCEEIAQQLNGSEIRDR